LGPGSSFLAFPRSSSIGIRIIFLLSRPFEGGG
jgi:hypothetical protein